MTNKRRRWLRWSLQLTAVVVFFVLFNLYNTRGAPSGPAPAISGQLLDATPVSLQALRGKPVLLQFWASWCPYCKALMPHLQTMADEYEGELTIYAINFRDDDDPQAFMQQNGYTFTLLLSGGAVAEQYEIWGTPGVLVFDQNNRQILNLYDVVTEVDAELAATEGLSHRDKAARKAPAWAAAIEAAL